MLHAPPVEALVLVRRLVAAGVRLALSTCGRALVSSIIQDYLNGIGYPILYTATSIALAAVELAVHTGTRPPDTMLLEINFDGAPPLCITDMIGGPLPGNWAADHGHTRPIGTLWLSQRKSVALAVPSVVIPA